MVKWVESDSVCTQNRGSDAYSVRKKRDLVCWTRLKLSMRIKEGTQVLWRKARIVCEQQLIVIHLCAVSAASPQLMARPLTKSGTVLTWYQLLGRWQMPGRCGLSCELLRGVPVGGSRPHQTPSPDKWRANDRMIWCKWVSRIRVEWVNHLVSN